MKRLIFVPDDFNQCVNITLFYYIFNSKISTVMIDYCFDRLSVPVLDPRVKRPAQTVVEAAHIVKHTV